MEKITEQSGKVIYMTPVLQRLFTFITALVLCFFCCAAHAETPELPKPMDGISPEDVDWSLVEEAELSNVPALFLVQIFYQTCVHISNSRGGDME